MKDWWIRVVIGIAVMYVSATINSSANAIAVNLAELMEKMEEMDGKIDALTEKIDDVECEVSGRGQKWRDKVDDLFGD